MSRYVIDAVTLLHLVDNGLPAGPGIQLVAPNAIRSDAMQLLLEAVRRGERTDREALRTHDRLTEVKIRLLGDRMSRATAWRIAREHEQFTLREAEYLAVTRLQADALVTVDAELAGRARALVPVGSLTDVTGPAAT
ncbi:hypothetical protein [Paractinoplanes maris]|uniref:hypothetical protein n=1 Tax=Paractinoplanes maris TaxID=1734446 RepID=UPI0020221B91|nr:hypothetical protein [Actinoplanes maris]